MLLSTLIRLSGGVLVCSSIPAHSAPTSRRLPRKKAVVDFGVSNFFRPNIGRQGRIGGGVSGALGLVAGVVVAGDISLWGLVLVIAGVFAIYEALSGWCLARACGVKTKI